MHNKIITYDIFALLIKKYKYRGRDPRQQIYSPAIFNVSPDDDITIPSFRRERNKHTCVDRFSREISIPTLLRARSFTKRGTVNV